MGQASIAIGMRATQSLPLLLCKWQSGWNDLFFMQL